MEMTRIEARALSAKIDATLNSETELAFEVVYALNKTKGKLKRIVDEIEEMVSASQKQERMISLKFCAKDESGKPVIVGNRYAGLEHGINPEYDEKIEKFIGDRLAYLNEKIDIEIHYVSVDMIPKTGKASVLEALCCFVKD